MGIEAVLDDLLASATSIELYSTSDGYIKAIVHEILSSDEHRIIAEYSNTDGFLEVMQIIKRWKDESYNALKNPHFFYQGRESTLVYGVPIMLDGYTLLKLSQ